PPAFSGVAAFKPSGRRLPLARAGGRDLDFIYSSIENRQYETPRPRRQSLMLANAQARPPFRADHVGSLLRPPSLRQAFKDYLARRIDDAHFAQIQDQCIRDVVGLQEEVGLAVVTDGEFRRGSYWGRFVERIEGFVIKPALFEFRDDHGHKVEFTAPYADG